MSMTAGLSSPICLKILLNAYIEFVGPAKLNLEYGVQVPSMRSLQDV